MSRIKRYVATNVRRVARVFAEEVRCELWESRRLESSAEVELLKRIALEAQQTEANGPERVKLDVIDAVKQLSSGSAKGPLQHLYSMNLRWVSMLNERNSRTAKETYDFIDSEMRDAIFILNQFDIVRSKAEAIDELHGQILDLGVYKGGSTRHLARIYPDKKIHGFDSFEGLPNDWSYDPKGSFGDISGVLSDVPDNVRLYKGWFEDTLPVWAAEHSDVPISLLRVDRDIYSSTMTIFENVGHLLKPGTWILFDELIGYRGWQDHEYKAFQEFLASTELDVEYVAYGLTYVLVRLSRSSSA